MEQQTISINKAGVQAQMNARASILAAAQPKMGRFDPNKPLAQNVDISPPLMSRFYMFFVLMDQCDDARDLEIARHLVREHSPEENADAPGGVSQPELQQYIRLARQYKPRVSRAARAQIVKDYKVMRQADLGFSRRTSRVTVRQLEALIRVCEAVARIHLSGTVEPPHVKMAYELVRCSVVSAEEGEYDLVAAEEEEERPKPAARVRGRVKLKYSEYERIARAATAYLDCREQNGEATTEEDVITWYTEQQMAVNPDMDEDEMLEQQQLISLVVRRLIDVDRVILVVNVSDDPDAPERRQIKKHPNFVPFADQRPRQVEDPFARKAREDTGEEA